ncbi:transporter substrate-binding domain-containing protein [Aquibacillus sp. 3ASR75-11]|uniref:Transporter substrate-binding domain-containing protein n=1 Tax=Terrihalobacillus insolitus TaxID=2950438 RepID=A0A9X3WYJ8_9BACI|nr:transporter substrate-binding domain-containing protein [Terrihalobacillus insolitus]MDC3425674.1 transporter substrate-binding domain-containing protein [Terrihalobacillus insolitus]
MLKKSMLILLLGLFLVVLAACGTSSEETGGDGGEQPADTEETEDTGSDAEATEDDSAADTEDDKVYTVATDNGYVPFEYLDEDSGELVGFDIDLIKALADEVGIEIDIQAMEFSGVVAGIGSGRFDIGIAGMTITEERKENIDFSQPYYDAGLILAVRSDNDEIKSVDDLSGKTVATRSGSTSETYIPSLALNFSNCSRIKG